MKVTITLDDTFLNEYVVSKLGYREMVSSSNPLDPNKIQNPVSKEQHFLNHLGKILGNMHASLEIPKAEKIARETKENEIKQNPVFDVKKEA